MATSVAAEAAAAAAATATATAVAENTLNISADDATSIIDLTNEVKKRSYHELSKSRADSEYFNNQCANEVVTAGITPASSKSCSETQDDDDEELQIQILISYEQKEAKRHSKNAALMNLISNQVSRGMHCLSFPRVYHHNPSLLIFVY